MIHRRRVITSCLGLVLSGVALKSTAQQAGQKRFALILANQTYEKNPLPNIDNDANLMAKTLTGLGFSVSTLMNGSRSTMRTKLKELKDNLAANPGGIGFVYYSGHGVQVDGENYLVPVNNGALTSEADVKEDCLSLSYVLEMSKGTQAKAYITVLDACRDNPFLGQKGDGNKGLAVVGRTLDASTLVAFAASPGETASATLGGANSIYTAELVKQLQTPNLSLQEVFQSTRSAVRTKSSNKQRPREDNGLEDQIYLNGRGAAATKDPVEAAVGSQPTTVRLELTGVPTGAKVTLNGATLVGSVYTDDIVEKSKSLEIAVVANGFKPYVHNVVISRGSSLVHAVVMELKPKPTISLTDYPATKAYLDSLQLCPGGTFKMGGNKTDAEKPVHSVSMSAFRIGATPVTFAVWKEYCASTGTGLPAAPEWGLLDDHPVVNVSWTDIMGSDGKGGFCSWVSDIAGFRLTLPSEAQFEYAARGGQDGLTYPWGNGFDDNKLWSSVVPLQNGNTLLDSVDMELSGRHTSILACASGQQIAIRTKQPKRSSTAPVVRANNIHRNNFGLSDMTGHVFQWCSDWYGDYSSAAQTDPTGPPASTNGSRSVRSGSWGQKQDTLRCAFRDKRTPDTRANNLSFRLTAGPNK